MVRSIQEKLVLEVIKFTSISNSSVAVAEATAVLEVIKFTSISNCKSEQSYHAFSFRSNKIYKYLKLHNGQ